MADKCHYAFFLAEKPSVLLQSVIWLTSMLPLWLTHTQNASSLARVYRQDCILVTPLTPSLIISRLARNLPTPIPTPIPTPSGAPTTSKMFHGKAENFTAVRKNFTASQKNLTASRKCFTLYHYSCLFLGRSALATLCLQRMRLLASPSALEQPQVRL